MVIAPHMDPVSLLFSQYKPREQLYTLPATPFIWATNDRSQTELANLEFLWADLQARIYAGLQQGLLKPSVLTALRPTLFQLVQSHINGNKSEIEAAEKKCTQFFLEHSHHQYYKNLVHFSLFLFTTSLLLYLSSFAALMLLGEAVFPQFACAAITSSSIALYGAMADILGLVYLNKVTNASDNIANTTLQMSHELNRFFSVRPNNPTLKANEASAAKTVRIEAASEAQPPLISPIR